MDFIQITKKKILIYAEDDKQEAKIREIIKNILSSITQLQRVLKV